MPDPSSAAPPGLQAGDVRAGYRFGRPLGQGPRARVHEGEQLRLKRRVALKTLHPALAARPIMRTAFLDAARDAAGLIHPHVLPVIDVVDDENAFVVMPFCSAPTLARIQFDGQTLPFQEVCQLALNVLDALRAIHATGRRHGNLWPGNVFWEDDGRYLVADFYQAPPIGAPARSDPFLLTRLAYVAPEMRLGGRGDARSDYFSLGGMLAAAASGASPGLTSTLEHERLAALPESFRELIRELTENDPADRPHDGPALAERVRAIRNEAMRSTGELAIPARAAMPPVNRRKYHRLPVDLPVAVSLPEVDARREAGAAVSRLRDVGENGVFVAAERPLPPGTVLALDFELPDGTPVRSLGVVRWINRPPAESGMGVQFVEVALGARMSLSDYVAGRLSDDAARQLTATPAHETFLGLLPELWGGGPRPVAEIAEMLGQDAFGALAVLADFADFGLVRLRHDGGEPDPDGTRTRAEMMRPTSEAFAHTLARLGGWPALADSPKHSTSFAPLGDPDAPDARSEVVEALRSVRRPPDAASGAPVSKEVP